MTRRRPRRRRLCCAPAEEAGADEAPAEVAEAEPERLSAPRAGRAADDLKKITGVGPKLEAC